jgi:hypothetical protein
MGTLSPGLMRLEQQGLARGMAAPFLGTLRRSARDLETEEELRAHLALAAEQMESARRPQTPAAGPG